MARTGPPPHQQAASSKRATHALHTLFADDFTHLSLNILFSCDMFPALLDAAVPHEAF